MLDLFGSKSQIAKYAIPEILKIAANCRAEKSDVDESELYSAIKIYVFLIAETAISWAFRNLPDGRIGGLENISPTSSGVDGALSVYLDNFDYRGIRDRLDAAFSEFSFPPPSLFQDIFKPLYMDVMPSRLRHANGEHYTPDWLADRALDIAGYDGNPAIRLLDPACGSGTFLIRAISRLRGKCESLGVSRRETLDLILKNVTGYDLDTVAVKTAATNYLLAISDLLQFADARMRIPIYRKDSVDVRADESPAPAERFDLAVGNPPWVNLESLSPEYRRKTKHLWEYHGLFPHGGMDSILGKSKKDLSMLLTYQVMEHFLKPDGLLVFIITRAALKSSGSGQGFRRFQLGDTTPMRPLAVEDFTDIKPFGQIASSPIIIALKKGESPVYPTPYKIWKSKRRKKPDAGSWATIEEAISKSNLIEAQAEPVDSDDPTSAWISAEGSALIALRKILGHSFYRAYAGIYSGGANGVYWLKVIEDRGDLTTVENLAEVGKHKVERIRADIETDLIFPLLRHCELKKWSAKPTGSILVTQDAARRRGIDESLMKSKYPNALDYLLRNEDMLRRRASWLRFFTAKKGDRLIEKAPFYSMFAVGEYTFAPYKTTWARMSSRLEACVVEPVNGRPVLPQETLTFIPFADPDEAHFACAIMNSTPMALAAGAYSESGGKGFGSPQILRYLKVPRFDSNIASHNDLAAISKAAHLGAASCEFRGHITSTCPRNSAFQKKLDLAAASVLGLSEDDLDLIDKAKF